MLGRLAEAGLIGGVTLIILWIVIALDTRRYWRSDHRHAWMATAAAAALLGTLVNTMNADVMNFRFAWVVLGLVRGLRETQNVAASLDPAGGRDFHLRA